MVDVKQSLQRFSSFFKHNWAHVLGLTALAIIYWLVVQANYDGNVWLTGWDNVHPEFNFSLNFKRNLDAVWQKNQGLGHLGGHGHAALLIHTTLLWILSLFVQTSSLRMVFTFVMLGVGSLGVFWLLAYLNRNKPIIGTSSGLIASLFYMLNLGTVQNFFTQLEAFIMFFGFLPWAVLGLLFFLNKPNLKRLVLLIIVNLLLSGTGFIPPLFVVYVLSLAGFMLAYLLQKLSLKRVKTLLLIPLVVLVTNAYWLLPVAYFTLTGAHVYLESQNNKLSTQDFNLQSLSYGRLEDAVLIRGFIFEAVDSPLEQPAPVFRIMQSWHDYLQTPNVIFIYYVFFALGLVGLVYSVLTKKWERIGFIILFLVGMIALAQALPPFAQIVSVIKEIPIISQAFRASFTKFSVAYALGYSVLIGLGMSGLASVIRKENLRKIIAIAILVPSALGIIFISKPVFDGKLLYEREKVSIPNDYLQLFEYLKNEDTNVKIANLPQAWNWGWILHDWGYSGSGFLWYGVEQPILDRAFDVWSSENESYYQELSSAIYHKDSQRFFKIIDKYDIGMLLIDESVVIPGVDSSKLFIEEIKGFIAQNNNVNLVQQWGKLSLYKVNTVNPLVNTKSNEFITVSQDIDYLRQDFIYEKQGSYIEASESNSYPFRDLLQRRPVQNITYKDDQIEIKRTVNGLGEKEIIFPGFKNGDIVELAVFAQPTSRGIEVNLASINTQIHINDSRYFNGFEKTYLLEFPVSSSTDYLRVGDQVFNIHNLNQLELIGSATLIVGEPFKLGIYDRTDSQQISLNKGLQQSSVTKCWERSNTQGIITKNSIESGIRITATDASACLANKIGQLENDLIVVNLDYQSPDGGRPHFCISREGDTQYTCYNKEVHANYTSKTSWTTLQQETIIENSGQYWLDLVGRPGDQPGQTNTLDYRNVSISVFNSSIDWEISADFWWELMQDKSFTTKFDENTTEVLVTIPYYATSQADFISEGLTADNCDVFDRGTVSSQTYENQLQISATNGAVGCKSIIFSKLDTRREYLVRMKGAWQEGRGPKFYVRNELTGQNELELLLDPNNFDSTYSLESWPDSVSQGYIVSMESRSFPYSTTTNTLELFNFYTVPVSWLTQIEIKPLDSKEINNKLKIEKINKTGISHHSIQLQGTDGLFYLSQGYDSGWNAYVVSRGLSEKLPWLFGSSLKQVKVNGWANGWIIDRDTVSQRHGNTNNNSFGGLISEDETPITVVIVYWPQYLQWLGFGILGLSVVGLTGISIWKRFSNRN